METTDALLIEHLAPNNPELSRLMAEHKGYESRISALNGRRWLSIEERVKLVGLKKRKLRGRDRIEAILVGHRVSARA